MVRTGATTMNELRIELSADALDGIAERVADRLAAVLVNAGGNPDRWMTTAEAAAYLGMTPNALHKLTSARKIPFEQEQRGGKCWFKASELDAWRTR